MKLTKQQTRLLRQLEKKEKELYKETGIWNNFTDNRQPLPELVQAAWQADDYEYWRLWTIFYLRICLLTKTTNTRGRILDELDAPLYLEQEMENHDYLTKYN